MDNKMIKAMDQASDLVQNEAKLDKIIQQKQPDNKPLNALKQKESKAQDTKPESYSVQEITAKLNKELSSLMPNIEFGYNERQGSLIVNVVSSETNKVIRTLPFDDALKIISNMREIKGLIYNKNA